MIKSLTSFCLFEAAIHLYFHPLKRQCIFLNLINKISNDQREIIQATYLTSFNFRPSKVFGSYSRFINPMSSYSWNFTAPFFKENIVIRKIRLQEDTNANKLLNILESMLSINWKRSHLLSFSSRLVIIINVGACRYKYYLSVLEFVTRDCFSNPVPSSPFYLKGVGWNEEHNFHSLVDKTIPHNNGQVEIRLRLSNSLKKGILNIKVLRETVWNALTQNVTQQEMRHMHLLFCCFWVSVNLSMVPENFRFFQQTLVGPWVV